MKKIIFQTHDMGIAGGVERVISMWVNYLVDELNLKEYEVGIVTGSKQESFYKLNDKINIDFCNYKPKIRFLPIIRQLAILKYFCKLKKNDIVIINKYMLVNSLYLLKKIGFLKDIKLVYFNHGGVSDLYSFYSKRRRKKIINTFDKIICLHEDIELSDEKLKHKIFIIPNPVTFKSNWVSDLTSKHVLCVGRLSKEKGVDLLLRAWKKTDRRDYKLLIVGEGEEKENLIRLSDELSIQDSVEFIGNKRRVIEYYINSSIYAMCSRYEGLPMVLLEAMECGLPIITYSNTGTKGLVSDIGIVVEDFDENIFSSKLSRLITDEKFRKELGGKSKNKVKKYYIENISCKMKELLEIR